MAFFKTVDFLKRNNAEVLINITSEKGEMTMGKKADGLKVKVTALMLGLSLCFDKDELLEYCERVKGTPPALLIEDHWYPVTRFFKDNRFVPKPRSKSAPDIRDKEFQQRQEKSLVEAINQWNQPVRIDNFKHRLARASQAPEIGPHGKENIVDVVVWDERDFSYNVSCKMSHAADLGGGGIAGLQRTVPELVERLYYQVQYDLYGLGFDEGTSYHINQIPTLMYGIPYISALQMFQGCDGIGGKIDYLYIGPDKVEVRDGKLNGEFADRDAQLVGRLDCRVDQVANDLVAVGRDADLATGAHQLDDEPRGVLRRQPRRGHARPVAPGAEDDAAQVQVPGDPQRPLAVTGVGQPFTPWREGYDGHGPSVIPPPPRVQGTATT